jgi:hypothetical protein
MVDMTTATEHRASAMDPATMTPAQWSGRLAALRSRGVADDDHRIAECQTALAYWRVRRVLDTEREHLAPAHVPALADMLKHAHPAVAS